MPHFLARGRIARRSASFTILLLAASATAADAQTLATSLDVGGVGVRYADSVNLSSMALSPALRLESPRATLAADGTYSLAGAALWSAQGELSASLFTGRLGPLRPELDGDVGGSTHASGTSTGRISAGLRLHLMRERWGVWAGAEGGRAWDGVAAHGIALADLGVWARWRDVTVVAGAAPTRVSGGGDYADADLGMRWVHGRAELGGALGARAGSAPVIGGGARVWGSASAALWVMHHLAIVAAAGSYPVDVAQGFPGGRFATLALRIATRRPGSEYASGARAPVGARGEAAVERFTISGSDGDQRVVRVRAPRASRVEIAGDFTDWRPVPLTPAGDGWFTVTLPVSAGTHQMNLRLDGSRWVVPPSLTAMTDEFGGTFGLLTVPTPPM